MRYSSRGVCLAVIVSFLLCSFTYAADAKPLRLLFLGDNGHHQPAARAEQLIPVLAPKGITIEYTNDVTMLLRDKLDSFDGLILYANIEKITPDQEKSLLDYVASGHGFIPIHCASFCFLNSPKFIALVGAQFQKHGGEVFSAVVGEPNHPIMKGYEGFQSWDETYIHHQHNENGRTVLEYRVQGPHAEGTKREPWTWVREEGKGRVFYTAWGHDERTWSNPGFLTLVERGIRWACGQDPSIVKPYVDPNRFDVPAITSFRKDVVPFEYVEVGAKIPIYPAGQKWGTQADSMSKMQKPLTPEESMKHFVTPVDFEVKLWASEKDFKGKPIAMDWDERGRLWICETIDYPNDLPPGGKGRDRILVCEDSDGDGSADRFTEFAEGLNIPTAILCTHGGVIVQSATDTLFLKDTDGDGKSDLRTVLISNWALGDTHAGVSNLHYGLDNWIWGVQGYNPSETVINGQKQPRFSMGFFRFKLDANDPPKVTAIEFLRSGHGNTWGLGFSEEGLVFGSSANNNPSLFMPIPNRYYERVRGWTPSLLVDTIADTPKFQAATDKVRQMDNHGAYSSAAGHALYTARVYPKQWWNRTAFVCEPEAHLVGTFVLRPQGATFRSNNPFNLLASDDEWSAPIIAEVGPDGNVWVVDWYNFIVQHNPTPHGFKTGKGNAYESDLRDKKHGRIYRIVYRGAEGKKPVPSPELDVNSLKSLVDALSHPNMFWRLEAQRLLVDRGKKDVVDSLLSLINDQSVDEIGLNVGAIHALHTLAGLKAIDEGTPAWDTANRALHHPSAAVRRAAIMSLPPTEAALKLIAESRVISDPDVQVRLAALLLVADAPPSDVGANLVATALGKLTKSDDRYMLDAVTSAAAAQAMPLFASSFIESNGGPEAEQWQVPVFTVVAEHLARGRMTEHELGQLFLRLRKSSSTIAGAILTGIVEGWPRDYKTGLSDDAERALIEKLPQLNESARYKVLRLASLLGSKRLTEQVDVLLTDLAKRVQDDSLAENERIESARQLIRLGPNNPDSVARIVAAINPQSSPELVQAFLDALGESTANNVGAELVERIAQLTPNGRQQAIRVLLSRPETTRVFLKGIEKGQAQLTDLSLDQRQGLQTHPDKMIAARAKKLIEAGGGLPDLDREKVLAELMPLTQKVGNVARGKEAFKKNCAKCHRHSGEGENIGPDLTGMAVHPRAELLMNIVDPSRSVESNYRAYTVALADGRVQNGLLAAESRTAIEIIDSEGKKHAIPREDVEELTASRKSFMPEGFEKQMKPEEMVDLLEFLAARGKYTPLDLRSIASTITTRGMFIGESNDVERLIFPDWNPKTFEGVPFYLIDPKGDRVPNALMLHGDIGTFPPRMPKSVKLVVNQPAKAIHFLGLISGWGYPAVSDKSVTVTVRIHYTDGEVENHDLLNGVHFADYIQRVDVPGSKFAFAVRNQQVRYLSVIPKRSVPIKEIELVKGPKDPTAPVIMAITAESP